MWYPHVHVNSDIFSSLHIFSFHFSENGKLITVGTTGSDPHVFHNADLVDKNLTIQGFSVFKWLAAAERGELDAAVAEISDLIASNVSFPIFVFAEDGLVGRGALVPS